jgi:hypothetical protein
MTSATLTVFESAIGLATQAVHQDKAKNYPEAARCYKEAIETFQLVKSKSANQTVSKAIDEKIHQYRDRLKRIEKYLFGKQDLSQLFRAVVSSHRSSNNIEQDGIQIDNISKIVNGDDECGRDVENILKRGLDAIEKAKRRDAKHNYKEALSLYEEGMMDLLAVAVNKQEYFPDDADVVKYKCLLIHERIEAICKHLETGAPLADRKDSNLEVIRDESRGCKSRHHSGNSNGFDSCSASPEPLLNITSNSSYSTTGKTTTITEEYEDEDEDQLLLMEEIQSNLSLASISATTSNTFHPISFPSIETSDTFQKALSEAGSRHSLYPMCEIKRSPSLMSGQSDVDILQGKMSSLGQKREHVIPLADLDQELCISSFSLRYVGGELVDKSDGVKPSMLSSVSSNTSLSKQKRRSLHSSAEDVLGDYVTCSTPDSEKNYTFTEKDRNVSELTYVNTSYLDPVAYKELCLNDSEGSDSGISSDPSPKNSARDTSSTSSPTMNTSNDIREDSIKDEEGTISRPVSEHSLCTNEEEEDKNVLLTIASTIVEEISLQAVTQPNIDNDNLQKQSQPNMSDSSSNNDVNAIDSPKTMSKPSSQNSLLSDKEEATKFLTPSPSLSRGDSKTSRASKLSRQEEDELLVLSAEEIVEVDSAPLLRSKSPKPKVKELSFEDLEVYGRARPEYVPPRAFARRPNEVDDDEGINKGCYYFMSCLDAFWIL